MEPTPVAEYSQADCGGGQSLFAGCPSFLRINKYSPHPRNK